MYNEIIVLGVLLSLFVRGVYRGFSCGAGGGRLYRPEPANPFAHRLYPADRAADLGAFKLLSRYMLLFGRRQFAVMILVSFALAQLLGLLLPYDPGIIGYLVPGIMANQFVRQGPLKTLLALTVVVGFLALLMFLAGIPVF